MIKKVLFILAISTLPAMAQQQQQADPVFMQHAINSLQTQRNAALDAAALAEAKLSSAMDSIAQLQAKIKELEKKPEDKVAEPDKK
jgi:predicted  nucleic acid-binding Zn-ribbon protein